MQHEILMRPAYSALRVVLDTNEEIHAESGAMLAMDATATIEGTMRGGLLQAIKRSMLTSESFFVTTIRGTKADTEVFLAPRATGDIEVLELKDQTYIVQGGSFLASTSGITTDSKFTGWKGFMSGEGIFMVQASGTGSMFISSFGGILKKEVKAKEKFIVDNGHVVAFSADMTYTIDRVGKDLTNMVTTGEGLAVIFEGPGTIYMQTRNLRTFAETLNPFLPQRQASQGRGMLGQIMGG